MQNKFSIVRLSPLLAFFLVFLSSCEIIGDIFEAGVWVGIIVVVGVIALIIWLIARLGGRK
jgi:hypothetical protein